MGKEFKSGFIAIIGPPNVGKSTLLNRILGEKLSIISPRPQTTRNRILGVYNEGDCQMVFMDTPGIHPTKSVLHKSMVESAKISISEVDIILLMVGPESPYSNDETGIILRQLKKTDKPTMLALNKIDLIKKQNLLPLIQAYDSLYPFAAVIPVSALRRDGLDILKKEIKRYLPQGPRLFPPDIKTDKSEEFLVAETIREKIFLETRQELPYSSSVLIERMEEDRRRNLLVVTGVIYVERESQKKIIIGKNGKTIKKIGKDSRVEIEGLFSHRVYLDLFVKVEKNWSKNTRALKKFGY